MDSGRGTLFAFRLVAGRVCSIDDKGDGMPLFEFYCEDCERQFELLVSAREKPECPGCQSSRLEKLMSVSAGRMTSGGALPIAANCPPPQAGPCGPACCRLP